MKYPLIIICYALFAALILYIFENSIQPTYGVLLIMKVSLFLIIPLLIGYFCRIQVGKAGTWSKKSLTYGVPLGLLSIVVIGITYMLLRDQISWDAIEASMEARHITESTFILVFLYIMFGNSLLEEYFFRGVLHFQLSKFSKTSAYIISALAFSLYHITIFGTWFSGWILGLALFGLFAGGVFFSWLYEKTGSIWSAWVFHILADLAILVIGYIEFFL